MIPSDWRRCRLAEVCSKITDGTHDTPTKQATGIPFLTAIHIKDRIADFENCYFVDPKTHAEIFARCNPKKGDVLFVNIGAGTGSSVLVDVDFEFSLKNIALLKPDRQKIDGRYLQAYQEFVKPNLVTRLLAGGAQPFLSLNAIGDLKISIPPLHEQKAIVDVLSVWDFGIRHLSDLIAAKVRFKQGLMQQLLTGKRRFKGFIDEWHPVHLKDVTEECDERNQGRLGIEAVMAVTRAEGIVPMRERTIAADINRYLVVKKDCFAYNPMRINIGSIARWTGNNDILVSPDYVVFRCKKPVKGEVAIDPDFLDQYRRSGLWQRYVTSSGNGSVRVRIYYSDLGVMKLRLPSLQEQRKITGLLKAADREIDSLRKTLDAIKRQKKGLMQKLLTGQVRVGGVT
jgi:type I restriction enzyme, S subunit